ncbi:hypothetical protein ABFY41_03715 [Acinetobacter haemolyticus]|uniref:hypothetical protein n=1 Tax=Acinetobacter haemolyticus TaxID=29430 RepID=UPI002A6B8444|nr:hypothetical protein [Acinetobacter haemolyticus]WPO67697.1 hypothetical protein SDC64_01775 [Acinetobacter haemolyticus]
MNNKLEDDIRPLKLKPNYKGDGEDIFYINQKLVNKKDEIALTLMYICDRQLFGMGYRILMRELFDGMGKKSGVLICPFIKSQTILPSLSFPGDLDLLIIPYDNDQLIISKTLVVEVKVIRAKFLKQQKSPNDFGFSQANGLLEAGFPYVAVLHLIISDESPQDYWREIMMARIIGHDGEAESLGLLKKDMMPVDLIKRAYGRLNANCLNASMGLLASYIELEEPHGKWFPIGRPALSNPKSSQDTFDKIANFYYKNYEFFMDTSKW